MKNRWGSSPSRDRRCFTALPLDVDLRLVDFVELAQRFDAIEIRRAPAGHTGLGKSVESRIPFRARRQPAHRGEKSTAGRLPPPLRRPRAMPSSTSPRPSPPTAMKDAVRAGGPMLAYAVVASSRARTSQARRCSGVDPATGLASSRRTSAPPR